LSESLNGGAQLGGLGADGKIILKWILKIGREVANWFQIAEDMEQWRDVVNDDQWRYSLDQALASLMGFMIVCSTMWGWDVVNSIMNFPVPL
jgi:hypothetical protein